MLNTFMKLDFFFFFFFFFFLSQRQHKQQSGAVVVLRSSGPCRHDAWTDLLPEEVLRSAASGVTCKNVP